MKSNQKLGMLILLISVVSSFATISFPVGLRNLVLPVNVPLPRPLNSTVSTAAGACSFSPTLPTGLSVVYQASNCKIVGTPTVATAQTVYTLTTTSAGTAVETLTVTPVANLSYTQNVANYTVGAVIDTNFPSVVGSATGYAVTSGTLPAGLSLNASTGAITGTPTSVTAPSAVTITASNSGFTSNATLTVAVVAAANYGAWSYSKNITIAPTGLGKNVGNYPVLLKLDSTNFNFSQSTANISPVPAGTNDTGTGGGDIRFTKADGITDLPYQIERWNSLTSQAEIWVLVPSVGIGGTTIKMYFGKSGATTTNNPTAVFDTAMKFQAVWHMNQGGTGDEQDATPNNYLAHDSTVASFDPTSGTGAIGLGRKFAGAPNQYFSATNATNVTGFSQNGTYTVSAWENLGVTPTTVYYTILQKHDRQFALQLNNVNPNKWESAEYNGDSTNTGGTSVGGWQGVGCSGCTAPFTAGLHYLVGQHDGFAQRLYIDGVLQYNNTTTNTSPSTTAPTLTSPVHIGKQAETVAAATGTGSRPWNGLLDEIRMHNTVRDTNWIKADFQTQSPTGTALTYGATVSIGGTPLISVNPAAQTVQLPANTVKFFVVVTGTGPFTYKWIRTRIAGTDTLANTGIFTGTATDTLRLTGVTMSDSGSTFKCLVSNIAGAAVSGSASLTVLPVVVGISPSYVVHVKGLSPFSFRIPEGVNAVRMSVENMKGRAVWSGELTPTRERIVSWNGSGMDGHPVSPGMYVVRLNFTASGR